MGFGGSRGRRHGPSRRSVPGTTPQVPPPESSGVGQEVAAPPPEFFHPLQETISNALDRIPEREMEQVEFDLDVPIESWWFENDEWWWALECKRRKDRLDRILGIPDAALRMETIQAEILLCREDPVYFINNYCWMEAPKDLRQHMRDLPAVLWPKQRELVSFIEERYQASRPALVIKGRELGVSWIACMWNYNKFREEHKFRAKFGSRKEQLVDGDEDSIFAKLRYIHARMPGFLKPPVRDRNLKLTNTATGGEITGEATNAGFARGGRRATINLDEFAHVEPIAVGGKIWTSIQGSARLFFIFSSPNGPGNKFAELYEKVLPKESIFDMDWTSDPRRDEEWKRKQLETMSEDDFNQEHGAKIIVMKAGKIWTPKKAEVSYNDKTPAREELEPMRYSLPIVGGWDFGSGASELVCLLAMVKLRTLPKRDPEDEDEKPVQIPEVWVEQELVWKQTSWRTAAEDVKMVLRDYSRNHYHFGDPAGRAPESDQSSWETNLRNGGIPMMCLPDASNSRQQKEWAIKIVGAMMAEGRLRVHAGCTYLWSCIDNWRRAVPDGLELDVISSSYVSPRHDKYSHGGWALCYLIEGILRSLGTLMPSNTFDQAEARRRLRNPRRASESDDCSGPLYLPRGGGPAGITRILPPIAGGVFGRVMGRGSSFDDGD